MYEERSIGACTSCQCRQEYFNCAGGDETLLYSRSPFHFQPGPVGYKFQEYGGRSLRKGFGPSGAKLEGNAVTAKRKLERVTAMCTVNAAGESFKPVTVYPGKQPKFRCVHGRYESVVKTLLTLYLFHRDPPGANIQIFHEWAKTFVEETSHLRDEGRNWYSYYTALAVTYNTACYNFFLITTLWLLDSPHTFHTF